MVNSSMMHIVFLLAVLVVSQALEEENCQAQTNDMRAMVILIRQLRTDMTPLQKTVATQQKELVSLQDKIASQEREIEALMNKTVVSLQDKIASQEREIEALMNKTKQTEENLRMQESDIAEMRNTTGYLQQTLHHAVGFSVKNLYQVSSGVMTFYYAETNTDNSYNLSTGVFTCKTPGYYYFSATLVKALSYKEEAHCYMKKNAVTLVAAYTRPGLTTHEGETAAVASVYVHLAEGDTIKLSLCTPISSWKTSYVGVFSFFSGYLVTPDAA